MSKLLVKHILPLSGGRTAVPGDEATINDFPEGVDFARLIEIGAIIPLEGDVEALKARARKADTLETKVEKLERLVKALWPSSNRQWESVSIENLKEIAAIYDKSFDDQASKADLIQLING